MFSNITRLLNGLTTDPVGTLITLLYMAVVILLSLILHECAHGYAALRCGDPTARWMGRLTLDPRKHLDPYGTICMVILGVGWARPVPVNPRNFRHYRRDYILVSLAGIAMNLALCLLSLCIAALLCRALWVPEFLSSVRESSQGAALLDVYHYGIANAIYGGSYVGYDLMMQSTALAWVQRLFLMLAQTNLGLAIFNLIPVPPLDGYRFLDEFVFHGRLSLNPQTMQIIHVVFLVICVSGALSGFLTTLNAGAFSFFARLFAPIV